MTNGELRAILNRPRHDDERTALSLALATLGFIMEFYEEGKPLHLVRQFGPLATHKRQLLYAQFMRNFGWEVSIESKKDILYGPIGRSRPPDVHEITLTPISQEEAAA
jgi:hypothetical protein